MNKWKRVGRSSPCAICGKPDWCLVLQAEDGPVYLCMRVESDRPHNFRDGQTGWLHNDKSQAKVPDVPVRGPSRSKKLSREKIAAIVRSAYLAPGADEARRSLAASWRISEATLRRLYVGWWRDEWSGESWWSFPARDGEGTVIGITRRYADGRKKTLAGTSNSGVFVGEYWWSRPGPVFLVEGPSDTAILDDVGACVIGRPSNQGGVNHIAEMLRRRGRLDDVVFVVGERDERELGTDDHDDELCDGCPRCWPGYYGMTATVERLRERLAGCDIRPAIAGGRKDVRDLWDHGELDEWLDERWREATGHPCPLIPPAESEERMLRLVDGLGTD